MAVGAGSASSPTWLTAAKPLGAGLVVGAVVIALRLGDWLVKGDPRLNLRGRVGDRTLGDRFTAGLAAIDGIA